MKLILNYIMLTSALTFFAQNDVNDTYSYELELGTDNDFLVIQTSTDKYYTYGINATLRWTVDRPTFLNKLFSTKTGYFESAGINVEAYTPDYSSDSDETDRPYAGWSYAEYDATYGFEKSFFQMGVDVGILGPNSKAGDIQNWVHEHVTSNTVLKGWDNQIANQFGFNLNAFYARSFFEDNFFDVYLSSRASLGNIFSYIQPGINIRLGNFNPLASSTSFQNSILGHKKNKELFIDAGVAARVSAYNATIQGDKIRNLNIVDNEEINNFLLNAHIGIYFAYDRWTVGSRYVYSSGEINNNDNQEYTMLTFSYKYK